jgi:glycosyltransferase involved in cell wall biosynthesis
MNVLLEAYACRPNAGTEPGHGWNWAVHLVERGMTVTVLTRDDGRKDIEAFERDHPNSNLKFVYVNVPTKYFKDRSVSHYILWHWRALRVAKVLHREHPFDIVHHVTYGSLHVPTQLWRLGVPTVFGPVGGGQVAPESLLKYLGVSSRSERLRTLITRALPYSPLHRHWLKKMSAVIAVNTDTNTLVRAMGRSDVEQLMDIAVVESFLSPLPPCVPLKSSTLRLLWVGRIIPRKGLRLALEALAEARCSASLTIVGESPDEAGLRKEIADRGLTDRVHWAGKRLPWSEVRELYLKHEALLFTSVRDSSGAQMLEAMALGLPIITLDQHGAKDLVPSDAGIKVAVKSIGVARDLADAMERFAKLTTEDRTAMSLAAWKFAAKNTWSARAERAASLYDELVRRA